MDVTPRELRDIDIREGFRGYNRDDVDELLERAAGTIEALNERVRRLTEQVSSAESAPTSATTAGGSRETEEMLHRTLLLAQRAADEAVAEAQFKARQILDDAESKARAQLSEAESSARRQVEGERRRLESEVLELASRREALLADVDGLEKFESEYRQRLRRALETDLESLAGKVPAAPSARPPIHDVDLPQAEGAGASTPAPPAAAPSFTPTATPQTPQPPASDAGPPTAEIRSVPSWDQPAPTPGPSTPSTPSPEGSTTLGGSAAAAAATNDAPTGEAARPPLFAAESGNDAEPLDDEAFFASLREAVSDQSPLGPRDDASDSPSSFEDDKKSGLFRRRR
jgi:DivIVA domain-containing protein